MTRWQSSLKDLNARGRALVEDRYSEGSQEEPMKKILVFNRISKDIIEARPNNSQSCQYEFPCRMESFYGEIGFLQPPRAKQDFSSHLSFEQRCQRKMFSIFKAQASFSTNHQIPIKWEFPNEEEKRNYLSNFCSMNTHLHNAVCQWGPRNCSHVRLGRG